jgi:hypothetical protein
MVELSMDVRRAIRGGLAATAEAVAAFQQGCEDLRRMPEAEPIQRHLGLAVARLKAMGEDLADRESAGMNQDGLFIALHVMQAGMSSLTDALGEMREACHQMQPHPEPQSGWFIEAEEDLS